MFPKIRRPNKSLDPLHTVRKLKHHNKSIRIPDTKSILNSSKKNTGLLKKDLTKIHNLEMGLSPTERKNLIRDKAYDPHKCNIFMLTPQRSKLKKIDVKHKKMNLSILRKRTSMNNSSLSEYDNKRTHGFTMAFHGNMFEDNSMTKEVRKKVSFSYPFNFY